MFFSNPALGYDSVDLSIYFLGLILTSLIPAIAIFVAVRRLERRLRCLLDKQAKAKSA